MWLKIPQSCHFLRLWAEGWYGSDLLLHHHHHLNHHQQFFVTKKPRSYFNDVLQSPFATIDFSQMLKYWVCHQSVKYLGNWKPSALKSLIKLLSSSHIPQKISSSEALGQIYASVSLKTNEFSRTNSFILFLLISLYHIKVLDQQNMVAQLTRNKSCC